MKVVLAISGGVDSMAMLDICMRKFAREDLIVAHFDHNVRENSQEDLEFVRRAADEKKLKFVFETAEKNVCKSEDAARKNRYEFLRKVAARYDAEIFTAHHLDDLAETVAINFIRGTGWRGLAAMDAKNIRRPFLETEILNLYEPMDKAAIFEYAAKRGLRFREDQTNTEQDFLRNRVRERLESTIFNSEEKQGSKCEKNENKILKGEGVIFTSESKILLYDLWRKQKKLRREIEENVAGILAKTGGKWQREWFEKMEKKTALEILRAATSRKGIMMTRPQLEDFYHAILNYAPGKKFNLPQDRMVKFTKNDFEFED